MPPGCRSVWPRQGRRRACPASQSAGPQPAALSESQGLPEAVPAARLPLGVAEAPAQGPHSSEPPSVCARYPHAGRGRGASAPQKPAGRGRRGAVAGRPGLLKILLLQVKRHFENALPTTPLQQGILGYSALAQIHSHLLAMYRSRCLIYRRIKIKSDDVMS